MACSNKDIHIEKIEEIIRTQAMEHMTNFLVHFSVKEIQSRFSKSLIKHGPHIPTQ